MEIYAEHGLLASRFAWSLKVFRSDTDRSAIYDFLLVIHSKHGRMSYRFGDERRFLSKIAIFPTPVYFPPPIFNALAEAFSFEFCKCGAAANKN